LLAALATATPAVLADSARAGYTDHGSERVILMDTEVLRILDANINRAREALRVVEDYARFALDDADAAEAAKRSRHALQEIVAALGAGELLAARDIVGDVGRGVKTAAELQRSEPADVVRAALARLSEAARGLGEYGKLVSEPAAAVAEALRYAAYELEQRIVLRGERRARFRALRLYVLVTEQLCRKHWLETAEAAIHGGAGCLQLREKDLGDAELLRRARELRELTARYGVLLAINNRPDIAKLAGADIVHLGQEDLSVREARHVAGTHMLVGKSTHTRAQFEAAAAEEPDYLSVGPMFESHTKPQGHVAGPQTLAAAAKRTPLPLVAIGGIRADNAAAIIQAGASCVAVCAAVIGADAPERAARAIRSAIAG
jgi:thiamine-phosphate pyrophosphorylase